MAKGAKTSARGTGPTDIPAAHWIDRALPRAARPYARLMRLDRPIGTWLLLFPCWWSVALGTLAPDREMAWRFALFALGAVVMRGAGCTWNDITDREFDARVARTRTRPIASGEVSVRRAVLFLAAQLALGLLILLQFNAYTVWLGVASLVVVVLYPLAKRVTYWPQFGLGLAFNWGALMGWAAVNGSLGPPALLLYAAGIFWTLGYDTIYAHQDKEDDLIVGVKSSAIRLGRATRPFLFGVYGAAIALMAWAGGTMGFGWPFHAGLALAAAQLLWQAARVDIDDPADCLAKFKSNRLFGWLVLGGLLAEHAAWLAG